MSTWIMIIILMTGSGDGGIAIEQVSFSTKRICEAAQAIIGRNFKKVRRGYISISCVENFRF